MSNEIYVLSRETISILRKESLSMDILKQTVMTGNSIWERGKEVVVEGAVKLPDTFPPIASVIGVSSSAETEQPEVSDGKVLVTGKLRLSILYVDQDGEFVPFDSQTHFTHSLAVDGITDDMTVYCQVFTGDVDFKLADSSTINLRTYLHIDVTALANKEDDILSWDTGVKDVETSLASDAFPYVRSSKSSRTYLKNDLRIPQNMPPAQSILFSKAYAVVRSANTEPDKVVVEGDLRVMLVYLSADKNAPLQCISETFPFGEIVNMADCAPGDQIYASAQLENMSANLTEEDGDLVSISATLELECAAFGSKNLSFVKDMYSTTNQLTVSNRPIGSSVLSTLNCLKRIVRLGMTVPDDAPQVSRVLFSCGSAELTAIKQNNNRVTVEGIVHLHLCYTTADMGIQCIKTDIPFDTDATPEDLKNAKLLMRAFLENTNVDGSGRELEVKCSLDLFAVAADDKAALAAASAEIGDPLPDVQPRIIVYYADGTESVWDLAKKFAVKQSAITLGEEMEGPIPKGTKITLIRS